MSWIGSRSVRWSWQTTGLYLLLGTVLLTCAAIGFYEAYVPGRVSEVAGSIVSVDSVARRTGTGLQHYAFVRLDGGETVHARADSFVTLMPGERVSLVAIETPLFHFRRYRYKRDLEPARNAAAPAERLTP